MGTFRLALIIMTVIIVLSTSIAVSNGGLNFLEHYFEAIFSMNWQGQFNLDFGSYLVLSGFWMAWRKGFTPGSVGLGFCAIFLGMLFFAPYLIYLIQKNGGDPRKLLLGVHA